MHVDDEVVLLGRQEDDEITAEEIASLIPTINYEIVSSLATRVEKRHIGQPVIRCNNTCGEQ